jgi:phospholipid-binding lipoprotein MlaA
MVLPIFGPSTVRDTIALPLDRSMTPGALVDGGANRLGIAAFELLNTRSELLAATKLLDEIALDRYSFVRDAYLARRRSLVFDGDPPDLPEPPAAAASEPADRAASAASAASAPSAPAPSATPASGPPAK